MFADVLQRAIRFGARHIDYRMAVIGALFMGSLVFAVNLSHGPGPASVAAAKQATYTFFFAGWVMRTCERLAVGLEPGAVAIAVAFVVPSCMAVGFTYLVHSLRGTPDPVASTIPTLLIAPPSFLWWAVKHRRQRAAATSPNDTSPSRTEGRM